MFNFISKKLFPIRRIVEGSTIQLRFLQNPSALKSFPPKSSADRQSFTVSYLISSCELSPETAISASKKVHLETSERPDSVLNLFRNHGFTETQISKLIKKHPLVLVADPEKTLLPKLEFLCSAGISSADIAKIISSDPDVLRRSLEHQIIPSFNFYKSVVGCTERVVAALKRGSSVLGHDLQNHMARNLVVLRKCRVPESNILMLLSSQPRVMVQKHDRFNEIVEETKKMGFDPLKSAFVVALIGFTAMSKSTWERKLEAYRKWGLSDEEILLAFEKNPWCMTLSEKKIKKGMDFLVNKMGWEASVIARSPVVLSYSLEKRIIPRCSVIQVLLLKDLIKEELNVHTVLVTTEKYFLKKFVTKYVKEVPQLLNVYKGKMDLLELGCGFEEMIGVKQLKDVQI